MKRLHLCALALLLQLGGLASAAPGSGLDLPNFDAKVRAQDDLFRAANGGWLRHAHIPADKGSYGAFEQLADLSDQQLHAIVDSLAAQPQAEGSKEQKIASLYRSFLDTAAIDRAGIAPLRPLLAEVDAIQDRQQLLQWFGHQQGLLNTPLRLSVGPDARQPLLNRVSISQGGLGLPERDYYLDRKDRRMAQSRAAYLAYLGQLAHQIGIKDGSAAARQVMALEERIAALHWDVVAMRDPQKAYNPMTPAELSTLAPGVDWDAFLGASHIGAQEQLNIAQPSAVTGIARLLAEQPLPAWKLYAKLHLSDAFATVLPKPLREASFAFHGKAMSGSQQPLPRWQLGVGELNESLGEALGQLYVAKHFTPAHKARMQALVTQLMAAYKDSIDGLAWMSPATKAAAQEKLSKYQVKIGYPEQWRDYGALQVRDGEPLGNRQRAAAFAWAREAAKAGQPVDRSEWGMTPQTVNAYYNETFNEIVFPAAILQPPFFDLEADDAVNYGAIGAVIGHEISHGFDDQGSQYDGDGRLRNWWTEEDRKAFDAIAAQLVRQFDAYQALPGKHVNGKLTLGENIADLSGLQIAYKAYLRSLGGRPAPVIDGYSGAQRFFLGFSQVWREKVREPALLQQLTADPHSPGVFRANGAAINHDAFHEAFGTRPGDQLYKAPEQRIRIW